MSPVRIRLPVAAPAPIPNVRAFLDPSPRYLPRVSAVVELPTAAVDLPINPPAFAIAARLPVLPAPPLKTDNLAPLPPAIAARVSGRLEAAGFGSAAVTRAYTPRAPPPAIGGFAAATRERAVPSDPSPPSPAGFGDASVSTTPSSPARIASAPSAFPTPVEILEKPRPLYSEEARRLRLEGEVLVEVLFPAAGPAYVLRVLKGLGHGLDENAMAAVQGIRFRPAKRAGQAVDSSAIVHIVFQIAY
jgi:TonB family protein